MQPSSVVLLSGGLDSVCAFFMAREQSRVVLALTFHYGQKSHDQEIQAARRIAESAGVPHQVVDVPLFQHLKGHPLFDVAQDCPSLPTERLDDLSLARQTAKAVWVPNRNGILLNVAAALAEAQGAKYIYVGFNAEEAATFPDNSAAYMDAATRSFAFSTQNHVEVRSPTVNLVKREIVAELARRKFDFSLLWSCYLSGDKMCGHCESCLRLKRALAANDVNFNELFFP